MENPYVPELVKIKKVIQETPDTRTFVIEKPMKFEPGQFVEVSVLNIGEAPFCMSNYSEKQIELTVRNVGSVTNSLHSMKPGDKIGVRGPFGHGYPMQQMNGNDIVLIAGGGGIVPIKSVLEYIQQHRGDFRQVRLFLGFKSPEDIIFKSQIERWKKQFEVNVTVDKAMGSWAGCVGNVCSLMEKGGLPNSGSIAILCGPPVMIKFAIESLKKLGWNDDQIYVSLERLMQCGIMKCGHCMVGGKYVCRDGPVFRHDTAAWLSDG